MATSRFVAFALGAAILCGHWPASAFARQDDQRACGAIDTDLTPARRQEYATLVAQAVTARLEPSAVRIRHFMQSAPWSAVHASTPVGEDGVFFFEDVDGRQRFREVWGGWADPSDRPELIGWARKLGAPEGLAACFADVVTRH